MNCIHLPPLSIPVCTEPHASLHDQYLKSYVTTGKAKVIGRPRDLIAQSKDGMLIHTKLHTHAHHSLFNIHTCMFYACKYVHIHSPLIAFSVVLTLVAARLADAGEAGGERAVDRHRAHLYRHHLPSRGTHTFNKCTRSRSQKMCVHVPATSTRTISSSYIFLLILHTPFQTQQIFSRTHVQNKFTHVRSGGARHQREAQRQERAAAGARECVPSGHTGCRH